MFTENICLFDKKKTMSNRIFENENVFYYEYFLGNSIPD